MTKFHSDRKILLIMLVLILVAGWIRLYDGGQTAEYRYDQGELSQISLQTAYGPEIPLLGMISSAGVRNSPVTAYLLAPFFRISDNPLHVTIMIALWNAFGVGIFFMLINRYMGLRTAFWAALAYAVSPFAIAYSRAIWGQDYHTPLMVLAFWLGFYGFWEGRKWVQLFVLPLLMITFQINLSAWTLAPIWIWQVWVGRRNIHWGFFTVSILLGLLTLVPYGLGLQSMSSGTTERANIIMNILASGVGYRADTIGHIFQLTTGLGIEMLSSGFGIYSSMLVPVTRLPYIWETLSIFLLLGCWRLWKSHRNLTPGILMWAFLTMLIYIPTWTGAGIHKHHLVPSIPALALLVGLGVMQSSLWLQKLSPRARWIPYIFVLVIFANQIVVMISLYAFRMEYHVAPSGQTSTPLGLLNQVRESLIIYDDVLILGANPHESNYYMWAPMLYNSAECVRDLLINGGNVDVLPRGPFAVLVAPLHPLNANYVVPERYRHENPLVVPLRHGEDPYIIYSFEQAPIWTESPIQDVGSWEFESGAALTGYHLSETHLQLRWFLQQSEGESLQYFAHFLNAAGEKIGQQDAPFYAGQYWCAGDTIVTGVTIDLPPQTVTLRVGMYRLLDYGRTQGIPVVDATKQPIQQWVDILLDN